MQCQFNQNNKQCKANAMANSSYCFSHNPATRKAKQEAVIKGGLAKKHEDLVLLESIELKNPEQVIELLEDTINRIRRVNQEGEMPIKVASTIGFLATHLLRAMETSDLDKRLEIIENAILQRKTQERQLK